MKSVVVLTLAISSFALSWASLSLFWNSTMTFHRDGKGSTLALNTLLKPSETLFVLLWPAMVSWNLFHVDTGNSGWTLLSFLLPM